jgi:pimeloyl-ACP methyl ester carboxylesterase
LEAFMVSDREILSRLEKANVPQLVELVSRPDADEGRVLRAYFGDARFRELQELALRASTAAVTNKGNVVVLHGIMGGELTLHETANDDDLIWVSIWRLFLGGFTQLICNDDGSSSMDVTATGILKSYYGKQLVALSGNWNVRAFWYDWRADIEASADALEDHINQWFGSDSPVHLVAHSMGGLVARQFIASHPARWKSMWDTANAGAAGGRLIMLGTPNFGSFAIPLLYMGLDSLVNKMAIVDVKHNSDDLLQTAKTFIGTYQMLPSLEKMPEMQRLYDPGTYGALNPLQSRFSSSLRFQNGLKGVFDSNRMVYVAGYNQPTADGIVDWNNLHKMEGYHFSMRGDGIVPHTLGLLDGVTTYFVEEEHGKLPDNADVITAVDDILRTGATTILPTSIPDTIRAVETPATSDAARAVAVARYNSEVQRLQQLVGTMNIWRASGSMPEVFSREERLAMDDIMTEFAGTTAGAAFDIARPFF